MATAATPTAVSTALDHYTHMMAREEQEQNALPFWMREDDNAEDSDDDQPRSAVFCGSLTALCSALTHLHPLESPRRQQQRPQEENKRFIPASEDRGVTGAGGSIEDDEAHTDAEEEEVEVDMMMRASPTRRTTPSPRSMQPPPLSFLQQQGHDDMQEHAPSSVSPTPLNEMLTTLRNRPHPAPFSPPVSTRERLTAAIVGAPKVPQKFVQCMSCQEEEWLQVPRTAKYVRCPTCSSITIALASNTRFPEGEGGVGGGQGEATARLLLSPCTKIMALFSFGGGQREL